MIEGVSKGKPKHRVPDVAISSEPRSRTAVHVSGEKAGTRQVPTKEDQATIGTFTENLIRLVRCRQKS